MERINANEVQSMMEAYASVYKTEEQEVISEEVTEDTQVIGGKQYGGAMRGIKGPIHYLDTLLQGRKKADEIARNRGVLPKTGGGSGSGSGGGSSMGGLPADYKKTELEAGKTAEKYRTGAGLPKSGGGNQGQGSAPKSNPNVTKDGTKFERRLPTMAELRAAQSARAAAPKVLSRSEIENRAVKAGVGVSKGTVKDPKIAADAARKAELERIRSRAASQTKAGVKPTVASTADPKTSPSAAAKTATSGASAGSAAGGIINPMKGKFTVVDKVSGTSNTYNPGQKMSVPDSSLTQAAQSALRAGSSAAGSAAKPAAATPVVKKQRMGMRNRMRMEEIDVFDTIKEYLIGEGATEEEALKQMLTLTDEQRTEIIEGSCGSKMKKKKKGGY